jgi:N utilization substance protein B
MSDAKPAPGADHQPKAPKAPPKSARRRARELALQGLYEWLLSKDTGNQNAGAIDAHVRETTGFDRADAAHFDALLHGVMRDPEGLRALIAPHLDRPIIELSPVEHAVLLIGTFELKSHVEIPYRVVINEAVELAKSFGGTDGFRYVNGVLDKVAAQVRPHEVNVARKR